MIKDDLELQVTQKKITLLKEGLERPCNLPEKMKKIREEDLKSLIAELEQEVKEYREKNEVK